MSVDVYVVVIAGGSNNESLLCLGEMSVVMSVDMAAGECGRNCLLGLAGKRASIGGWGGKCPFTSLLVDRPRHHDQFWEV